MTSSHEFVVEIFELGEVSEALVQGNFGVVVASESVRNSGS
jgi:hypothetical protein